MHGSARKNNGSIRSVVICFGTLRLMKAAKENSVHLNMVCSDIYIYINDVGFGCNRLGPKGGGYFLIYHEACRVTLPLGL